MGARKKKWKNKFIFIFDTVYAPTYEEVTSTVEPSYDPRSILRRTIEVVDQSRIFRSIEGVTYHGL